MKKLQMSRNNKAGITLMSLTIYLTVMFVVLALVMRFTTYFSKNISDASDTTFETEFEKFNLYMLQETNKTDNGVYKISENKIVFADGNVIEYKKEEENEIGEIYYNDIKICKDVDSCTFTIPNNVEAGKVTIQVDITISGIRKQGINYSSIKSRLPIAYQEVEYIESTGTQYIDTGIIPNSTIKTEIDFTPLKWAGAVFGNYSENGTISNSNTLYISQEESIYLYSTDYGNTSNRLFIGDVSLGTRYQTIIDLKNGKAYLDGDEKTFTNNTIWQGSNNLVLFARTYNGVGYYGVLKLYGCKIYLNEALVADFIPCYSTKTINVNGEEYPTGTIGLYDTVNNEFHVNLGTGTFLKGNEIFTKTEKESTYIISPKIPKGYQEVEYIEGDNTGYIPTDIYLTGNDITKIKFRTPTTGSLVCCLYGSYRADENDNYSVYIQSANPSYFRYAGNLYNAIKFDNDTKYELEMCANYIKLNNDTYNPNFTEQAFTTYYPIYVGYINSSTSPKLKGRIYSFEIVGKAKLLPCIRKTDNKIGMYDVINDAFYPGTGSLTAGDNVYY